MTIVRVETGRGHKYINEDTGVRVKGVTTIVDKGVPKPGLIKWSADATIEYLVDHREELATVPPSELIKTLSRARSLVTDKAKRKGTTIHTLAAQLLVGQVVKIPEGLDGYVQAYVRFLDEWKVEPILSEFVVVSHEHDYCGTGDLIADLLDADDPGGSLISWLLEIKTTRSGVWGESALQLAGYRYADAYVLDGVEYPIPNVERTGVVWVRPDGYSLVPVEVGLAQHRTLLYAQQMAAFVEESRDLVGEPLDPPRASTYRLQEERP